MCWDWFSTDYYDSYPTGSWPLIRVVLRRAPSACFAAVVGAALPPVPGLRFAPTTRPAAATTS